jgi:hypothetical protein
MKSSTGCTRHLETSVFENGGGSLGENKCYLDSMLSFRRKANSIDLDGTQANFVRKETWTTRLCLLYGFHCYIEPRGLLYITSGDHPHPRICLAYGYSVPP